MKSLVTGTLIVDTPNILSVGSDSQFRKSIHRHLRELHFDHREVCCVAEFWSECSRHQPNVVLLDASFAHVEVVEFVGQVTDRLTHVSVIVIADLNSINVAVSCMSNGASGLIAKPLDTMRLRTEIENARCVAHARANSWGLPPPVDHANRSVHPPIPTMAEMERALISEALAEAGGDVAAAARKLQISLATVYRRIKKYGIKGVSSS